MGDNKRDDLDKIVAETQDDKPLTNTDIQQQLEKSQPIDNILDEQDEWDKLLDEDESLESENLSNLDIQDIEALPKPEANSELVPNTGSILKLVHVKAQYEQQIIKSKSINKTLLFNEVAESHEIKKLYVPSNSENVRVVLDQNEPPVIDIVKQHQSPIFDLSSINNTNGVVINGLSMNNRLSESVSKAGDINNDGIDDIIIGVIGSSPIALGQSGSAAVLFGSANNLPSSLTLADFNGANGFVMVVPELGANLGRDVSLAGDINGDGIDDIIVGANFSNFFDKSSGAAFVIFGSGADFDATLDVHSLDGENGFIIGFAKAGIQSGFSVSNLGDVNGDSIDDLIIGAPKASPNGISLAGESYVIFGSTSPFSPTFDLSTLNGNNGFKLFGAIANGESGRSVANAGDINGDNINDIIIGAPGSNLAYVIFGSQSTFAPEIDLSTLDGSNGFIITDLVDNNLFIFDFVVSSAGDINGDNIDDIIVGSADSDSSYVLFGKNDHFAQEIDVSALDGSNGFKIIGAGFSARSAGDVNGDNVDDIILGNTSANTAFVVFGSINSFASQLDLNALNGTNGYALVGGNGTGWDVSGAGDVNKDGVDDLIISSIFESINSAISVGKTYIVFGRNANAENILTVFENTTYVYDVNASDPEGETENGGGLKYSISGVDSLFFEINADSGELTFKVAPDSEDPKDAGNDNIYNIQVTVTDRNGAGVSVSKELAISVVNSYESLFDNASNTIDLNSVSKNLFDYGTLFNALGGNDNVTLPTAQNRSYLGYNEDYTFFGGQGDDVIEGNDMNDIIDGSDGIDMIVFKGNIHDYTFSLGKSSNILIVEDSFSGRDGTDTITNFEQIKFAGLQYNLIFGTNLGGTHNVVPAAPATLLIGLEGNDVLNGGDGDDVLIGGAGSDTMNGGNGSDRFVYYSVGDRADIINNFNVGINQDIIDLSFLNVPAGNTHGYLRFSASGANTLIQIDADGGGNSYITLATLTNVDPLTILPSNYLVTSLPPIVLDLNDNGIQLISSEESNIVWDVFHNDREYIMGWVAPEDAILIYDYDNDRKVSDVNEFMLTAHAHGAKSDLQALQFAFDTNNDNIFNHFDALFNQFGAWQDANTNGVVDTGEYATLNERMIIGINLNSRIEDPLDEQSNHNSINQYLSYQTSDGQTHIAADVGLSIIFDKVEVANDKSTGFSLPVELVEHVESSQDSSILVLDVFVDGNIISGLDDLQAEIPENKSAQLLKAVIDAQMTVQEVGAAVLQNMQTEHTQVPQSDVIFA